MNVTTIDWLRWAFLGVILIWMAGLTLYAEVSFRRTHRRRAAR